MRDVINGRSLIARKVLLMIKLNWTFFGFKCICDLKLQNLPLKVQISCFFKSCFYFISKEIKKKIFEPVHFLPIIYVPNFVSLNLKLYNLLLYCCKKQNQKIPSELHCKCFLYLSNYTYFPRLVKNINQL